MKMEGKWNEERKEVKRWIKKLEEKVKGIELQEEKGVRKEDRGNEKG